MTIELLRIPLLVLGGYLLYRLWRATDSDYTPIRLLIATGFLIRTLAGQLLFWISYLGLPVGRSMQVGSGIWFFGQDGTYYLAEAAKVASGGPWAILTLNRGGASVSYVQALAVATSLFGSVASTALLLNLFCYLGSCYVIVRWSRSQDPRRARVAAAIAIAAVSFAPSLVLWSMQPLKDTMFQFVVLAFVGAAVMWQNAWTRGARLPGFVAGALMAGALLLVAGLRWYFAVALFLATMVFLLFVTIVAPGRRFAAAASSIILIFVLSRAVVIGAGPYLPPYIVAVLQPTSKAAPLTRVSSEAGTNLKNIRDGFDRTGGATLIRVRGSSPEEKPKTEPSEAQVAAPSSPQPATKRGPAAGTPPPMTSASSARSTQPSTSGAAAAPPVARVAAVEHTSVRPQLPSIAVRKKTPTETPHAPPAAPVTSTPHVPQTTTSAATVAASPPAIVTPAPAQSSEHRSPERVEARTPPAKTSAARVPERNSSTTVAPSSGAAHPPASKTTTAVGAFPASPSSGADAAGSQRTSSNRPSPERMPRTPAKTRVTRAPERKNNSTAVAPPHVAETPAKQTAVPPATAPAATPPLPHAVELPKSHAARIAAGATALVVPRSIGNAIGLYHIGGGRGMWLVSDIDTLLFDAAVLCALVFAFRARLWQWARRPVFLLVVLVTVLIAVPLLYTVANFGTLFRMRGMLLLGAALIPLALATVVRRPEEVRASEAFTADAAGASRPA